MPKMILIGGTGRCGTSILKEILALHPHAASLPFEYRFIIDPDGLVDFYASFSAIWSPYIADRKLKRLERLLTQLAFEPQGHRMASGLTRRLNRDGKRFSPRAYHGWELGRHLPSYEKHIQDLMSQLIAFSFPACWVGTESYQVSPRVYHSPPRTKADLAPLLGGFVQNVITDFLEASDKDFYVEDNTWNILFARELTELLPEARIIHVYRDPRDVVASFSQQRWSPHDKVLGAQWYKDMMSRWFEIRSTLPSDSFLELSLESLVAAPQVTLREICEFAAIPFDQRMLDIDLSYAHSGRWKDEFDPTEKVQIQEILADQILALGYNLD